MEHVRKYLRHQPKVEHQWSALEAREFPAKAREEAAEMAPRRLLKFWIGGLLWARGGGGGGRGRRRGRRRCGRVEKGAGEQPGGEVEEHGEGERGGEGEGKRRARAA